MMNGSFLVSRGAVHSGLLASDFAAAEIRRSWAGWRYGAWQIDELLTTWQAYGASRTQWRERRYGGYRVKRVDSTGFWRPQLGGQVSKHYHALAQKALPAIVFGVMSRSGSVNGKRVPLLQAVVRCPVDKGGRDFRQLLLQEAVKQTVADEVTVLDGEFELADLQAAHVQRFVVRLATNCTARWNRLPAAKAKGRPSEYGELVRPLPRTRLQNPIAATLAQRHGTFVFEGRTIRYDSWHDLVTPQTKVHPDHQTFTICLL